MTNQIPPKTQPGPIDRLGFWLLAQRDQAMTIGLVLACLLAFQTLLSVPIGLFAIFPVRLCSVAILGLYGCILPGYSAFAVAAPMVLVELTSWFVPLLPDALAALVGHATMNFIISGALLSTAVVIFTVLLRVLPSPWQAAEAFLAVWVLFVLVLELAMPDLVPFWQNYYLTLVSLLFGPQQDELYSQLAQYYWQQQMILRQISVLAYGCFCFAWWQRLQGRCDNYWQQWLMVRMSYLHLMLLALVYCCYALTWLSPYSAAVVAVMLVPMLAGMSLFHDFVLVMLNESDAASRQFLLIGLAIMTILFDPLRWLMICIGIVDVMVDFRRYFHYNQRH